MINTLASITFTPELLILLLVVFLLGALMVNLPLYLSWRKRHHGVESRYQRAEQAHTAAREEVARLTGQLNQMREQMQEQSSLLREARSQLGQEFENLANRIFDNKQKQFDVQNQQTLKQSIGPLKQQLDDFKKQVADVYQKESAERNQLIGKIGELQLQTQKIGEDAVNLALALKGDNKAQGNWGEMVLERILEESGLQKGREYDTQVSLTTEEGQRRAPDVIIYLPDDKQLVIDAKVSLVNYERYVSEQRDEDKQVALAAHVQSVGNHIRQLSKKNYDQLEGIQSLDFVFLFMPVEAAFMLALQEEPKLFKEAYDRHIVLVSPTTLMATLRTVANLWRYHKQHKNAEEIAEQAGGLYDQFSRLLESLDDLGAQINKVQGSYDTVRKRLVDGRGNLVRRIENLRVLGAKARKQLPVDQLSDNESLELVPENFGNEKNKGEVFE